MKRIDFIGTGLATGRGTSVELEKATGGYEYRIDEAILLCSEFAKILMNWHSICLACYYMVTGVKEWHLIWIVTSAYMRRH